MGIHKNMYFIVNSIVAVVGVVGIVKSLLGVLILRSTPPGLMMG